MARLFFKSFSLALALVAFAYGATDTFSLTQSAFPAMPSSLPDVSSCALDFTSRACYSMPNLHAFDTPPLPPPRWYYPSIRAMPMGIGVNVFAARQEFLITDLVVSNPVVAGGADFLVDPSIFNVSPVPISTFSGSARLDIWVLPFLNLYAIAGYSPVNIPLTFNAFSDGLHFPGTPDIPCPPPLGCTIPGQPPVSIQPISVGTTLKASSTNYAGGALLAFPISDVGWGSIDYTRVLNVKSIGTPTMPLNSANARIGKSFHDLAIRGQRTSFWVGMNAIGLPRNVESGYFPVALLYEAVNVDPAKREAIRESVDSFIETLPPEKILCSNVFQCAGNPIGTEIDNPVCRIMPSPYLCHDAAKVLQQDVQQGLADKNSALYNSDIKYSIKKFPDSPIAGTIGVEQQLYNIALRLEGAFGLSRAQLVFSLQYRFE